MGYYKCPRCGSEDHYQGNELVSGSVSNGSVGMVNFEGVSLQRSLGSSLSTKQVKVIKCRACGEILGKDNYHLTHEEIREQKRVKAEEAARNRKNLIIYGKVFAAGVVVLLIWIGIESRIETSQQLEAVAKLQEERNAPSEPENTATNSEPSNVNATSFPVPNPSANLPAGKQRDWSFGTGQPADLDRAYIGQPASVITNAFGMPTSFTNVNGLIVWQYNQMKISWQGTNYNKANVILAPNPQGSVRVRSVTVIPSSAVLGDGSSNPDAPSPAP